MPGFRLLRRARADVLDIANYTADRWGEQQAERYIGELFAGFQKLVDFPELRRAYADIPPYWRVLEGKHAVFLSCGRRRRNPDRSRAACSEAAGVAFDGR